MKNLSIRKQLLLGMTIPIFVLLYFTINIINSSNLEKEKLFEVNNYLKFTIKASSLIHQLQIERGLTGGYLASDGKKFKEKLLLQRKIVDKSYKDIKYFTLYENSWKNYLE